MSEEEKKQCECNGNCKEVLTNDEIANTEEEIVKSVGYLDIILAKLSSRKLIVFLISTIFLSLGKITSSEWMMVSSVYIGAETLLDAIVRMKKD